MMIARFRSPAAGRALLPIAAAAFPALLFLGACCALSWRGRDETARRGPPQGSDLMSRAAK